MNEKSLPDSNNFTGSIPRESSLSADQSVPRNEISIPAYADTTKGKYLSFDVKMFPMKSENIMVCKHDDCNYNDIKSRTFSKHLLSHIDEEDKLDYFHCAQSNCITGTRPVLSQLITHLKIHISNNIKVSPHNCDICNFRAVYRYQLSNHIKTKTHQEVVKKHNLAQIGSTGQDTIINQASNIKSYDCQSCAFTTPNKHIFFKHKKYQHKLKKAKYFCQICYFKTNKRFCFLQHQKTKKHLKQVIEQQISGKVDQTQVAREHKTYSVVKDSPTKFIFHCTKCKYVTYTRSTLDQHIVVHLKDEERIKFKCEKCPYTTIHKGNMHRHKKGCEAIANHLKCDKCPYTTTYKNYLQSHEKIHLSPQKRDVYKCTLDKCSFTSHYKCSLKRHKEKYHMTEIENTSSDTNESTSSRKRKHSPERNIPTESVVFIKSEPASAHIFDAKHRIDNQTPLWFAEPSIKQEVSESEVADHGLTFFSELPIEFRELPPQVSYQVKSDIRQAIKHYKELDDQAREKYLNERMTKQKSNGLIIRALEGQDEVIAARDIKQYELLGHYAGMTRSQTSYDKGADAMNFSLINIDRYSYNVSSKQLISGFRQGNITSLINSYTNYGAVENDSSVPEQNVAFLRHLDKKNKWVVFILAIKDIDKDAQLWIDYGPNYWEAMNETIELDNNDIEPMQ